MMSSKKYLYLVQIENDFTVEDTLVNTDIELAALEDEELKEQLSSKFELTEKDEITLIDLKSTNSITLE